MSPDRLKRRDFITFGRRGGTPGRSGTAAPDRVRRIGVQMNWDENDLRQRAISPRLREGLPIADRRPQRADRRSLAAGNVDRAQIFAKGLVDLLPDVILASTTPVTAASSGRRGLTLIICHRRRPSAGLRRGLPRRPVPAVSGHAPHQRCSSKRFNNSPRNLFGSPNRYSFFARRRRSS
jgi:hypothetical protein